MKQIFALIASLLFSQVLLAANVSTISYSGTNVTTSAYVTFVASTPINSSGIIVCDSSGELLKLAVGAAASEVDLFTMPISSCMQVQLGTVIPAGSRLSLKAISATASTGYGSVSQLK